MQLKIAYNILFKDLSFENSTARSRKSLILSSSPPILQKSKKLRLSVKLDSLYKKIKDFDTPSPTSTHYKNPNHTKPSNLILPFILPKALTPNKKTEIYYSEWELKLAVKPPKTSNLRIRRNSLITSLKSYDHQHYKIL